MELQIRIVGVLLVFLGLMHIGFPRYFRWKEELAALKRINREMMVIHTFFIALVVIGMGMICFYNAEVMLTTPFGKTICLAFAVFWSLRLLIQFFGYSSELWRGKQFETTLHILFIILWTYVSAVFCLAVL